MRLGQWSYLLPLQRRGLALLPFFQAEVVSDRGWNLAAIVSDGLRRDLQKCIQVNFGRILVSQCVDAEQRGSDVPVR